MSKRWRNKFLALIYTSVTWFRKRNLWTLYSENEIIGEKIWDVLRSKKKSNKRPYSERGSAKWLIKKKYTNLKEFGNFFENFFAVWKSLTRSRHSHAGSLQSGLPGHHSRWWRDCMVPRGSLTSSSTCTPSLQNHKPIIVLISSHTLKVTYFAQPHQLYSVFLYTHCNGEQNQAPKAQVHKGNIW